MAQPDLGQAGLFGRDGELQRLRAQLVMGRSCVLTGPAGIGKSALQRAVVESLSSQEWTPVLHGLEILADTALAPWQPLFAGRLPRGGSDEEIVATTLESIRGRVLLVDDVQWFDPRSARILDRVASSAVTLVTGRTPADAYRHRLPGLFGSATIIEVPPLSPTDAAALARALRPGASDTDIDDVVEHGAGNPLFIKFSAATEKTAADPISAAVSVLDPDLLSSLVLLVAAETGVIRSLVDDADALIAIGLATALDDGSVRVAHACVCDAVRALVAPARLADAHRLLGSVTDDPLTRARHLYRSGDRAAARDAGLAAVDKTDDRATRAALLDLAATADPENRTELSVDAAEALVEIGHGDRGVELTQSIGPCPTPDLERRRLTALARGAWSNGRPDKASALAALAMTDADRHPVEVVRLRSILTRITGRIDWDPASALEHASAGLAVSERHGLSATEALSAMATALLVGGRDGWADHLHRAIVLARQSGDGLGELMAADTLFIGEMLLGDIDQCPALAREALARATQLDVSFAADRFRRNELLSRMLLGADPAATSSEAREQLGRPMIQDVHQHLAVIGSIAFADVGDDLAAREVLAAAPRPADHDPTSRALRRVGMAETHLAAGRYEDCLTSAEGCLAELVVGFPAHQWVAPARSWAAYELGKAPPSPVGSGYPNAERFLAETRAIDSLATDPASALAAFSIALDEWGDTCSRYTLRIELGMHIARLELGDSEAPDSTSRLVERCDRLGFVALARRGRRLIRCHGGHAVRRLPSKSGLVTGAQEEMLTLVMEGLTTREIADRLQVSPATVDSSIASAQQGLGARSRLAAAIRVRMALDDRGSRGLRYSTCRSTVLHAGSEAGHTAVVEELASAPAVPWALPASVVWTADVVDENSAAHVLRGLLRDGSLLVHLDPGASCAEEFLADARRVAFVELLEDSTVPELTPDEHHLLNLVRDGVNPTEIAAEIHTSRRTAERRLAGLRDVLGVETNAELANS